MNHNGLSQIKELLDTLNCGAALIDRAGVLVHLNRRLCEMWQRQCDQVIGHDIREFYHDAEDRRLISESLAHFDQKNETEFYLPLPDGERLPVVSSSRQVPGEKPLSDH